MRETQSFQCSEESGTSDFSRRGIFYIILLRLSYQNGKMHVHIFYQRQNLNNQVLKTMIISVPKRWLELEPLALPSKSIVEKKSLPECSCVYFLIKQENEIVYVGQTNNLYKRIKSHEKIKQLKNIDIIISWVEVKDLCEAYDLERFFIDKFEPRLNKDVSNLNSLRPTSEYLCYMCIKENDLTEEAINKRMRKNKISKNLSCNYDVSFLSPSDQYLLRYIEKLYFSFSDIASRLGVSRGAISQLYSRIEKNLISKYN
ncbi:MAG: GIY-YIG nuclease family protein [Nostoc sp.]